jgi:cytochrome c oxidase subunit I+III
MSKSLPDSATPLRRGLDRVWANWTGWGTLAAVNHTTVGRRFIVTGLAFFLVGGLLAMLMRTQLALPGQDILGAALYQQAFTMHGTVMMFLFAVPILEGLAIYLVPKLIGARDLLFPRVSSLAYYCYLFGGLLLLSSLFLGMAPDAGWFMYTPLSSGVYSPGMGSDFWLLGITFVEISAIATGVELTVSILRSKCPGMSLRALPIFCWTTLVVALMIIFGFPPLILGSILLEIERAAQLPFFAVEAGGDPLLWQHLFWLFGHPEVYIIFLPAAGVVSMLIPVFAQRPLVGHRWVVLAVISTGFISFGVWVHHMFAVGIPHLAQAFFSVASMLVAVPTGVLVFAWLATLWTGRVIFSLPMLWILGFLVNFVNGGLTGVMLALAPFDWQVHDTQFVVAHFHYVLVGGMVFPLFAGLYYWLPHFSGRMPSQQLGKWGFWLFFIGFNMTFLLMHLTGLLGMPRRVYTYEPGLGWDWLNLLSSVGGFVMAGGVAMVLLDLMLHFRYGRPAPVNPWRADTLEWATDLPPKAYNFASLPRIGNTRHPLWEQPDLPATIAAGGHGLANIAHGRRETYGTEAVTGKPRDIIHLPSNSWVPFLASLALAVMFIGILVKAYTVALVGVGLTLLLVMRWSWVNGAHPGAAPLSAANSEGLPLHSRTRDGPGRWGMIVTLLANGTLYLSLLFGWFYLWTVSPQWIVPEGSVPPWTPLLASGVVLTVATLGFHWLVERLIRGREDGLRSGLWLVALLGVGHCVLLGWALHSAALDPRSYAHDAVLLVMFLYLLIHGGLAAIFTGLQALRAGFGYVGAALPYEPIVLRPLWFYTMGIFWLGFAAFFLLPMTWGDAFR